MTLLATALLLALTRQELIARFRAPVVTQCEGFVQVCAACPDEMRREFQLPVARHVGATCRTLYRGLRMKPVRFESPPLVIRLGDVTTNLTNVVVTVQTRDDGSPLTRLFLPAPGFADMRRVDLETVKAFYRAVKNEELDDAAARRRYLEADPELRVRENRRMLAAWRAEGATEPGMTDDDYLALMRRVHTPGVATKDDVLLFAARLYLYPTVYHAPFAGRYTSVDFAEAIPLAKTDMAVRFAALQKVQELQTFGGGRGHAMSDAVQSYCDFLMALVRGETGEAELALMLERADDRLRAVLD